MYFEDVIKEYNAFQNFSEMDESAWDYYGDDESYERTKDYGVFSDNDDNYYAI